MTNWIPPDPPPYPPLVTDLQKSLLHPDELFDKDEFIKALSEYAAELEEAQTKDMDKKREPAWYWKVLGYFPGDDKKGKRAEIKEARNRQRVFLERHHGQVEDYVRLNMAYEEANRTAVD